MDFKKWDNNADLEGLKKDIADASENKREFKEIPEGTYEVKVDKMELVESKKGDPMVTIWFKIVGKDYKDSLIFYNQVITQGFQIHQANEILRKMQSEITVEFKSYSDYAQLLLDIHEAIDLKNFKPPESLTVDEWADRYRRLSPESSAEAGPWNNNIGRFR